MILEAFVRGVSIMAGIIGFIMAGIVGIGFLGLVFTVFGKIFGEEEVDDD